jgi:hypothetical protein
LRIAFGIIWLIDAALKWLPGFRAGHMDSIMGVRDGQPGWLKPWFSADYYLERRYSWWWRLAEVRRPAVATPTTAPTASPAVPSAAGQPHAA